MDSSTGKSNSVSPTRPSYLHGGLLPESMNLKKIETEDKEQEDEYMCQLHQADAASTSSNHPAPPEAKISNIPSSKLPVLSVSKMDSSALKTEQQHASSSQRKHGKSVSEYKEILSGLKGKIQGKLARTIETRINAGSDKEHRLSGLLNKTNSKFDIVRAATRGQREQDANTSVTGFRPGSSGIPVKQNPVSKLNQGNNKKFQEAEGNICSPQSLQLRMLSDDHEIRGEDNTEFWDENFKNEAEEFVTTETVVSCRSKQKIQAGSQETFGIHTVSSVMSTFNAEVGDGENGFQKKCDVAENSGDYSLLLKLLPVMQLFSLNGRLFLHHKLMILTVFTFVSSVIPLPSFLSGLIMGCTLTLLCFRAYHFIMQPAELRELPTLIPLEELPPFSIPERKESALADDIYKGWMNEVTDYEPSKYHVNLTNSVFITLEKSKLHLQRPRDPVPKWAKHDENISCAEFVHERHFELKGCRVFLQPLDLAKNEIWSRKYPICLTVAEEENQVKELDRTSADLPHTATGYDTDEELTMKEESNTSVLFLFARTGREKEEWFHRLLAAAQEKPSVEAILKMQKAVTYQEGISSESVSLEHCGAADLSSIPVSESAESIPTNEMGKTDSVWEFVQYMERLMQTGAVILDPSRTDKATTQLPFHNSVINDSQLHWLNALIGRCFFDFLRDAGWADRVQEKLQRKINKIQVPYFIEELQVTAIELGKEMPVLKKSSYPYLDERGFWVELDVSYSGGFTMTIETKVNLMKLKHNSPQPAQPNICAASERSSTTSSDDEHSAESSAEDEGEPVVFPEEKERGGGRERLLKYLDKLTSSKYFQQATEYKYIKRAMQNVSNTPLQLQVSVKALVGKLAINIPPRPTDRLWYGFHGPPHLSLVAKPQVGERVVKFTHVTEWIQRRLELEFQRVFVMPNMNDLIIPIMQPSRDVGSD